MNSASFQSSRQRGATLIVALIMIALISLLVINAFTLSSSNLKAVGNMQAREEVIAAANQALEIVAGSPFTNGPVAQEINVDINKDGTSDYTVQVAAPRCIRAARVPSEDRCDVNLQALCAETDWHTDWDIAGTVVDAVTGARVVIHHGVRARITHVQKTAVCSSPSATPA